MGKLQVKWIAFEWTFGRWKDIESLSTKNQKSIDKYSDFMCDSKKQKSCEVNQIIQYDIIL